ncbi:MAG: glycosyltransferase family 39 protein [Bacteroidetes bacterium]|nr:glycosyltransferase family 39 protein [Bacteroidota bacterium]
MLYTILCVFLYIVIRSVFEVSDLFSICTVLLFALHPLHTEVVCSIKNRDEVLSLLFSLLALTFLVRFIKGQSYLWLLLGVITLTISLLSKYSGVMFVVIISSYLAISYGSNLFRFLLLLDVCHYLLIYCINNHQVRKDLNLF